MGKEIKEIFYIGDNYKCKCGSMDFFTEPKGNNIGLYCSMCGKWKNG